MFPLRLQAQRSAAFAPYDRESSRWLLISFLDSWCREFLLATAVQAVRSLATTKSTMDHLVSAASPLPCLAFDRRLAVSLIAGTAVPCPTTFYLLFAPENVHLCYTEITKEILDNVNFDRKFEK